MRELLKNQSIILIIVLMAILILLLLVFVFYRLGKLRRILDETNRDYMLISKEYKDLESAYKGAISSYNELNARYEELHKNRESIRKLAYTDYLIELPNRIAFIEMLDSIMLTLRTDEIIGIMDIDLDNFKNINDTLGHSYGDELLIDVTHRLKQVLGENDYLARIGGDEFVILTQNLKDMVSFEERIRKVRNVFSYPFILSGKEYFVTVSIGVAFAPKDGKTAQTLIKNVDSAMYMAKANGKNNYAYYEDSLNQLLTDKIELQSELENVREEFILFYRLRWTLRRRRLWASKH